MKIQVPEEPKEIKVWMESLRTQYLTSPGIDWDSFVVWAGNKLPKYLWDAWKADLRPRGFTWQKFMRLMHYRTDISVLWYQGALPWRNFVKGVIELIEGPLGSDLAKEVSTPRRKPSPPSSPNR